MKKYITLTSIIFLSFSSFAWTKVIRSNRGIFGYRSVDISNSGPNTIIACADPGRNGCHSNISGGGVTGTLLDNIVLSEINKMVDLIILNAAQSTNIEGVFYYGTGLYVEYFYDFQADRIETTIYTTKEANELGLI